jgi:glyoxylase I family protein
MFNGLEHTAIATPDPKTLAEWYRDNLGFRINHSYAGNYFVRAPNGTMIEFIPSEGQRAPQTMKDPGIRHLAVEVNDFEAAHGELKARGVKFVNEPFELGGNRLVFFEDGDGNYVHLIKRPSPLP